MKEQVPTRLSNALFKTKFRLKFSFWYLFDPNEEKMLLQFFCHDSYILREKAFKIEETGFFRRTTEKL